MSTIKESNKISRAAAPIEDRPGKSVLCNADEAELTALSSVVHECIGKGENRSRGISRRIAAFPLINHSPFKTASSIDRIDEAAALLGDQWLSALTLLDGLAFHLRSRLRGCSLESEEEAGRLWRQTLVLASAAEVLSRVTAKSRPVDAWACGLLLGALGASQLTDLMGQPPHEEIGPSVQISPSDLERLLAALSVQDDLPVPAKEAQPCGPWSVLSTAYHIACKNHDLSWASECLGPIPSCSCPAPLTTLISKRLSDLDASSETLAWASWTFASR